MKERVGDEKHIIISVAVRDINDHIRFYSSMPHTRIQLDTFRRTIIYTNVTTTRFYSLFIYKHRRQRAEATYMPVKSVQ